MLLGKGSDAQEEVKKREFNISTFHPSSPSISVPVLLHFPCDAAVRPSNVRAEQQSGVRSSHVQTHTWDRVAIAHRQIRRYSTIRGGMGDGVAVLHINVLDSLWSFIPKKKQVDRVCCCRLRLKSYQT